MWNISIFRKQDRKVLSNSTHVHENLKICSPISLQNYDYVLTSETQYVNEITFTKIVLFNRTIANYILL